MSERRWDFVFGICPMLVALCALFHSKLVDSELQELKKKVSAIDTEKQARPVDVSSTGKGDHERR